MTVRMGEQGKERKGGREKEIRATEQTGVHKLISLFEFHVDTAMLIPSELYCYKTS